jgi:ElaA protein
LLEWFSARKSSESLTSCGETANYDGDNVPTPVYDRRVISQLALHRATFDELDAATLYAILRLRTDVFVVEQRCAYPELDGRDLEPGTRHLWLAPPERPREPSAYLRVLAEADGSARIGRVCVAPAGRGAGLAADLMADALQLIGESTTAVLDAQTYLVGFYRRCGFVDDGPEFVEDGIPHLPMRRAAAGSPATEAPR